MSLRLEFDLWLRRHGWPAMAGILALVGLTLLMLAGALVHQKPEPIVLPTDGSRQLEAHQRAYRAILVPRGELEERQREVIDALLRHGLRAGRIDYGFENHESGRFGVATLQMPLQGSYADLRRFLATTLAAQPALAIEDLAIQRESADHRVMAHLKLGFHTEPGEAVR